MTKNDAGFTLAELIIILAIIGILTAVSVPGFINWLPGYRLRNAARDLYGNMQLAKVKAVQSNSDWAVVFDNSVSPGRYQICSDDGVNDVWDGDASIGGDDSCLKTVNLSNYSSDVDFGPGDATDDIPAGASAIGDTITYGSDVAVFNPRGMGSAGYVYLDNNRNAAWGVGSFSSGVIVIRMWTGSDWQ